MYAIYGNIYHQYTPNVSIYTIHGSYGYRFQFRPWFSVFFVTGTKSPKAIPIYTVDTLRRWLRQNFPDGAITQQSK